MIPFTRQREEREREKERERERERSFEKNNCRYKFLLTASHPVLGKKICCIRPKDIIFLI